MIPIGNKLMVEIISQEENDWNPLYKVMTKAKVIAVGNDVLEYIKIDSIITISKTDIHIIKDNIGFCTDRNCVFIDDLPHKDKVHINPRSKDITVFEKGKVLNSSITGLTSGDEVGYLKNGGMILPDYTEIISKNQIYFKS